MDDKERYDKILVHLVTAHTLWNIIQNIAQNPDDPDLQDLHQDLLLNLYTKEISLLEEMLQNGQMDYYLTRMVINQIRGSRSPFKSKYKGHQNNRVRIDEISEKLPAQ